MPFFVKKCFGIKATIFSLAGGWHFLNKLPNFSSTISPVAAVLFTASSPFALFIQLNHKEIGRHTVGISTFERITMISASHACTWGPSVYIPNFNGFFNSLNFRKNVSFQLYTDLSMKYILTGCIPISH